MPALISREIWEQAQFLLTDNPRRNVRAGKGKPRHRYTGLIKCFDCGSSFVCKTRRWRDKPERKEYVCNGNHRYGKEHCTPHRIDEAALDQLIYGELRQIKDEAVRNFESIEADIKRWMAQKNTADKKLNVLEEQLSRRKADQQDILLERIRDRGHADVYTQMLERCEADIERIAGEISSIRHYESTIKKRKAEMKRSVDLIDQIIAEGAVSDANLRLLVDEILIQEQNGQLHVTITLNAEFRRHMDFYDDNGELTDRAFAV